MEREEFTLSTEDAVKYLKLYVGEADWPTHIRVLYGRLQKKYSPQESKELMKKIIACTVLLPLYDKSKITDPPENLLFWCSTYSQFNERDWIKLLADVIEQDRNIEKYRRQCLSLGVVHPIEYMPVTRQAFNWLFSRAQDAGVVTDENKQDMVRRFQNLVLAYGGNVICHLFIKEEHKIGKKILNWRSNYFFERLIFESYTFDQVFKIKKQELAKTNSRLVKSIRLQEEE